MRCPKPCSTSPTCTSACADGSLDDVLELLGALVDDDGALVEVEVDDDGAAEVEDDDDDEADDEDELLDPPGCDVGRTGWGARWCSNPTRVPASTPTRPRAAGPG